MTAASPCSPAGLTTFALSQSNLSELSIHANWVLIGLNAWSVATPAPRSERELLCDRVRGGVVR